MKLRILLASAMFLLLISCNTVIPKGDDVIRQREISEPFDRVEVSSGLHLSLVDEINTSKIQVRTVENIHDYIETFVEGRTLIVRFRPKTAVIGVLHAAEIFVPVSVVKGVSASGGSEVTVRTTWRNPALQIDLSGGSHMTGTIETSDLNANLSGGSEADLSGKTVNYRLAVSGGSKALGFGLTAEALRINLSGGSRAEMRVSRIMEEVNLSGGSGFVYDGTPSIEHRIVNISGGSSMDHRND